jgi:NadR type nicotinamide-nucleotide adenylyltransferase
MRTIKKFVVIGPESTGKSTLCNQLAEYYHTLWVPEYAREYLLENGTDYIFEDLLTIAKGQIDLEEAVNHELSVINLKADTTQLKPLFIDTDMYVMKVWCEYVYNKCHNWILNRIADRHYDGYLLCNTDLPWVKDNLREYPDVEIRNKLYHFYKDLLVNQHVPWVDISGNYEERFDKAIKFINKNSEE